MRSTLAVDPALLSMPGRLSLSDYFQSGRRMTRPVVDRFIHSQASRSLSHRAVVGYRLMPPFAGRNAKGESR